MNPPDISIVMPVYNAGKYVEKSLKSLLNQTFSNFEIIIVDDGFTDNSLKIVSGFKDISYSWFCSFFLPSTM